MRPTSKMAVLLPPIVVNNDTEGKPTNGFDTRGFGYVELTAICGVSGDTLSGALLYTVKLEESDTDVDGNYAAITDAARVVTGLTPARTTAPDGTGIIATVDDPSEDPAHFRIGVHPKKRYARLWLDTTGTHTNGFPASIIAQGYLPSVAPSVDA